MVKRMLIDATHPEETRVVVLNGNRLEEFDFESATKKQLKGNIYLAKVTRVEPSLQAAFVDYGGNRHGFLAFNEIHPDYYRIPIADREALLAEARAAEHAREAAQDADDTEDAVYEADDRHHPHDDPGSEVNGEDADPGAHEFSADPAPGEVAEPAEPPPAAPEPPRLETHADDHSAPADAAPAGFAAPEAPASDEDDGAPRTMAAESANGSAIVDTSNGSEIEPVEVVGGDALEEVAPRRHRNFRNYKIQEVIARRQIMLVQVVKEERGTKGAALTTYLSLAGRYCVLMPNTPRGGGVSRKITSTGDRKRLKGMLDELDIPEGMAVIVRTAGMERSKAEIKRDYEYLLRLWDEIRALTLESTAPALIHEEGNLIKRSIRDLYTRDIDEVLVEGDEGYKGAKTFMKMIVPSHAKRVQLYRDPQVPLLHRYQIETQLDAIHNPTVQLKSGGYIVINQTEALVAIDVNSGRATRERHIEETALKTNVEAADEIARQVRLRDLAGLIVIDFIDMEENRNNHAVERRVKEAMKHDRARIQIGRISAFGLLELSRQRLRPSLAETSTERCPHCVGTGVVRSTESTALHVLRAIEEEGIRLRSAEIMVHVPTAIALYILNQKRAKLAEIEARYAFHVQIGRDDALVPPNFRLERLRNRAPGDPMPVTVLPPPAIEDDDDDIEVPDDEDIAVEDTERAASNGEHAAERDGEHGPDRGDDSERARRRRRRGRRRRGGREDGPAPRNEDGLGPRAEAFIGGPADDAPEGGFAPPHDTDGHDDAAPESEGERPAREAFGPTDDPTGSKRRRRGKRGGRRRNRRPSEEGGVEAGPENGSGGEPHERDTDRPRHGEIDRPADPGYVPIAAPHPHVPEQYPPYRAPEPSYAPPAYTPSSYTPSYTPPAERPYAAPEPEPAPVSARPEPEPPPYVAPTYTPPAYTPPAYSPPTPAESPRAAEPPAPAEAPRRVPAPPPEGVNVVVVDQAPESPRKGGWWRRLSK
jgi:ribonuclease E